MISFKQYLSKKKSQRLPALQTSFGEHSKEKKRLPSLQTVFGKHSEKPKNLKEDTEEVNHDKIHDREELPKHQGIRDYTTDSWGVNSALHNHYDKKNHNSANIQRAKEISDHMDKHASMKADTHVYSGIAENMFSKFHKHKVPKGENLKVHLPAFTSTSTDHSKAASFAQTEDDSRTKVSEGHKHLLDTKNTNTGVNKHVLKIHLKKGDKAGSVRNQSYNEHEHEILLHRGHDIEIHHKPEVTSYAGRSGHSKTFTWHAHIISHNPEKLETKE